VPEEFLKVNQRLQLEVEEENLKGRYFSRVEGVEKDSLIIGMPMSKGEVVSFHPGMRMKVIVLGGDALHQFESEVLERKMDLLPVLVISRPKEMKRVQRRDFFRVKASLPVQFRELEDITASSREEFKKAVSKDISGGGVLLLVNKAIPLETILELRIELRENEFIESVGRVMIVREGGGLKKRLKEVGVEFIVIEDKDREKVVKFIFEKQREQRHKELRWVDRLST